MHTQHTTLQETIGSRCGRSTADACSAGMAGSASVACNCQCGSPLAEHRTHQQALAQKWNSRATTLPHASARARHAMPMRGGRCVAVEHLGTSARPQCRDRAWFQAQSALELGSSTMARNRAQTTMKARCGGVLRWLHPSASPNGREHARFRAQTALESPS